MYIALGQFTIKSKSKLFKFLRISKRIEAQAKNSQGYIDVQLLGGNLSNFYVVSAWENLEDMKSFVHSGAHLEGIKLSSELAKEIRLIHYEARSIPSKQEIKNILANADQVKVSKY